MTIQELLKKIEESVLSPEAKKKIGDMMAGHEELTFELESAVKDAIQEDIDKDFVAVGIDDSNPEIQAIHAKLESDLAEVSTELNADMLFVDEQLSLLDDARKQITVLEDQQKIEDIKDGLMNQ
jgi:hypothetical protein